MGGAAMNMGQQQQGPQPGRPQQGPQPPGAINPQQRKLMGPPPPAAPQKMGFSDRLKKNFKNNKGSVGDALTAMGLAMMSQKSSTIPQSFGQSLGQAATAGFNEFNTSVERTREQEEEDRIKERQDLLFKQSQVDRKRDQRIEDMMSKRAEEDRQREIKRQAEQDKRNKVLYGHKLTAFDQANIKFEQDLAKYGNEVAETNRIQGLQKAMSDQDFESLPPDMQAMARYAFATGDSAGMQGVFNYMKDQNTKATSPKTSTTYNDALQVVTAQNPGASPEQLALLAANKYEEMKAKPEVVQTDKSVEYGQKDAVDFVKPFADNAKTARSNLQMLDNLEYAMEGVNTGQFGELLTETAAGLGQAARIAGLGDVYTQDYIDSVFDTDTQRAEVMRAISNKMTLNATKLLAGQISEKELQFSYETVPNIQNTPKGNKMIIDIMKAENQHTIDRDNYINQMRDPQTGALPGDIRFLVNQWDKKNKLSIEDDEGNLTPYGQMMVSKGYITRDEDWVDE